MVAISIPRAARGFVAVVFITVTAGVAQAAETCKPLFGELVSAQGRVEVQRSGEGPWQLATLNQMLCRGDTVRVGRRGRAAIALVNDAVLRLDQSTTMRLLNVTRKPEERSLLSLITGAFQSFSRKPRKLAVNTPYLNATIEGTEFALEVVQGRSLVTVFEGVVAAANGQGRVILAQGEAALAQEGQAPQKSIVARPRDAVQWALYYPPIMAVGDGEAEGPPGVARAARQLNRGRVNEARADIDRAIQQNANAGLAFALRAVIKVVQNQQKEALADARRAVELAPKAAAAKIALSYAHQAGFRLEDARDALLKAVKDEPRNALAWARLAELHLSLGDRGDAIDAAGKAAAISPKVERVQTVLGFASLISMDTTKAMKAFEAAIKLDSAASLPRFGLGLAKIKRSDLTEGRKDIEIAVGLDSSNAILRAYLGKAYFEEKRDPLDMEQLAMAKVFDPLDPTAYLYDAIRKQTENKPGEALRDLQDSIARNDNRAVYRSRQQLDQDRAARGTSLARVYSDLGFDRLGVNEASKSLSLDPANASAHRFLSDTYRNVRRHEIARVSELLQAQMFQDININPVQPSISETNLNIITSGGPATPGFNEFTPLFERNQAQLNVGGVGGNNRTWGAEAVASAVHDGASVSAGAFRYKTEGYRDNNELEHKIYNFFLQAALTPDLNAQIEARRRDSISGVQSLNFDADSFDPNSHRDLRQKMGRIGVRYSLSPSSVFLLSYIVNDRDDRDETFFLPVPALPNLVVRNPFRVKDEGDQAEGQYVFRTRGLNVVVGAARATVERRSTFTPHFGLPFGPFPAGFPTAPPIDIREDIDHTRAYLYANVKLPESVTWTVGASFDDYDQRNLELTEINHKFGIQWDVTENFRLRAATFKVVKPIVVNNQTLEPTQVAGVNQWYDDGNGTRSRVYGGGLDWKVARSLFLGAEAIYREFDDPVVINTLVNPRIEKEDRDETLYRGYLYWNPIPEISANAAVVYDRFRSDSLLLTNLPIDVETVSVPFGVRYFGPFGLFAGVGATYVKQVVDRVDTSSLGQGSTEFITMDAGIGLRLPYRRGVIGLQVTNVLDKNFRYQDDGYREFRDNPASGPYIPERLIMVRGSLNF